LVSFCLVKFQLTKVGNCEYISLLLLQVRGTREQDRSEQWN